MAKFKEILHLSKVKFLIVGILLVNINPLCANNVDGFTEPYRTINVSAAEPGIITELFVKEGDTVHHFL